MAGKWMRLVGMPLVALGVVGIAACGTSAAGSSGGGSGGGADMQALRACLAENGVTLPDRQQGGDGGTPPSGVAQPDGTNGGTPPTGAPGAGGSGQAPPGVDATTWAKAQQACAQYAPAGPSGAATS